MIIPSNYTSFFSSAYACRHWFYGWVGLLLMIGMIVLLGQSVAYGQDGGQTPTLPPTPSPSPDGVTTIHVVQRGDTLFSIALTYETTVEAIASANGIADTRLINIGQRLLIPGSAAVAIRTATEHVAQPGETLDTIALRYQTTPQRLARLNNLSHRRLLYAGQVLQISQGDNGIAPISGAGLYRTSPGDTQFSIAVRFNIPLARLRELNHWTATTPVFAGQLVILPDYEALAFVDLPAPLIDFELSPLPVRQGESLHLHFDTASDIDVTVRFMGRDVTVAKTRQGQQAIFDTMLGVHAMTEPDIYSLELSFDDGTTHIFLLEVLAGEYGFETVAIPPERQGLLDPAIVDAELTLVSTLMSQFTDPAYFTDLMALPAPGAITSNFGTRRSYNGSTTVTFHGGADFGGASGTPITAPAPGQVVLAQALQVRGNTVIIDHGWGVYTGYWHQQELHVQEGDFVTKGQLIGTIGSTGLSTGAHLHWEMWVSGVQVNPIQWVQETFR
jgi:murein DD-endopeptidase MepM/ murein hydrolase activator NlpD